MRYRIKIITYKNDRKEYIPQVKMLIGWGGISYEGDASYVYDAECSTRERALKRIDNHFDGNKQKQIIEFEYITKA